MSKRPTAIQLDRLAQAMKRFGYEPKRHELLDIAANAFGYRNSNEFTAAKLTPPIAEPIGTIEVQGSVVVLARDNVSHAIFAVEESFLMQVSAEERCETILPTPYGHLANVSRLLDDDLPNLDQEQVITTAIENQMTDDGYVIEDIQADARMYWSNVNGWGSLICATRFPDTSAPLPMTADEAVWRTVADATAVNSNTETWVGVKNYALATQIAECMVEDDQRIHATFTAQAWINDHAVACDPQGEKEYDVTIDLIAFALEQGSKTIEEYLENTDKDEFKIANNAPRWVQDYCGPFDIEIECTISTMNINLEDAKARLSA